VLVVDGAATGLTDLPPPEPRGHRIELRGTVALADDPARPAAGTLEARAAGYPDYALRSALRGIGPDDTTRPVLGEEYRAAAGVFALEAQQSTAAGALDRDFTWTARGSWSGLAAEGPGRGLTVRAPFWLPREWEAALHPRRSPLFLNQGYPLTLEETYRIAPPPGSARPSLPRARVSEAGPLRYAVRWSEDAGAVVASLSVEVGRGELVEADTAPFQAQLRGLLAALAEGATFGAEP
jgi:hypothetical protein